MAADGLWRRISRNVRSEWAQRHLPPVRAERDMRAAIGQEGGPASWRRARDGAPVGLHRRAWADARWSSIFRAGTDYAQATPADPDAIAAANLRGRRGDLPPVIQGPVMKAAVWTWEVPVYFWFGGIAAGSSFVAAGADLAGDARAARIARAVSFAALMPCPPLLIADLGRPERFFNMLRIFKTRSPMSTGSWCLSGFGALSFTTVLCDVIGRPRAARRVGLANVPLAAYLGSYTGVLLASTAIPLWGASRAFLGPIFITTATLNGAGACRLVLSMLGSGPADPTRVALGHVEDGAIAAELLLSAVNEHRLGDLASTMHTGEGAPWFRRATWLGRAGVGLRVLSGTSPGGRRLRGAEHLASVAFLATGLCYRMAWVRAGKTSAEDDAGVASVARARVPDSVRLEIHHQGQKPPSAAYGE